MASLVDESEFLRDVFPEARRRELDRWWLALQLEELSALGDQLRHLKREGSDDAMAGVLERVATVLEAVRWNGPAVVDELAEHLARVGELAHAEDAFGLALVCETLGGELLLAQLVDVLDPRGLALLRSTPDWPERSGSRQKSVHIGPHVHVGPNCSIGGACARATVGDCWDEVTETDPEAIARRGKASR